MRLRYYLPMGAAALLLFVATMCHAQVPQKMNYQVMLTDDANQPLADQSVQLVFRIYDVESGGGSLWTETHSPTTNSIGVVSVVLGNLNPLTLDFDVPLWLQVEVDGEPMTPRRALAAAPYALRAQGADHATGADSATEADHAAEADHATSADDAGHASAADQATDSDELGGVPAASSALDDDLWQPGTRNSSQRS